MTSKHKSGKENWSKFAATEKDSLFFENLWQATDSYGDGFEPDVEAGLNRFRNRIAQSEAKVVPMKSGFRWIKAAAAVAVLFAVGMIMRNFIGDSSALKTIAAADGVTKEIKLKDGTVVWLNQNSELSFPESFDGKTRTVQLSGEAYFEVAENPEQPFIINSESGKIEVLGTAFNFRTFSDENFGEVHVEHGKVELISKNNSSVILTKSQKAVFNKETGEILTSTDKSHNSTAWKTKQLSFKKMELKTILENMERHCGVDFEVGNEAVLNCAYTMSFEIRDIEEALDAIEIASGNKIEFEEFGTDVYSVKGNACMN